MLFVANVLMHCHWFGRSFRVISCPALGGFSCLGGEASREAEAGGSRAAHSEAERSERRALARRCAEWARVRSDEICKRSSQMGGWSLPIF